MGPGQAPPNLAAEGIAPIVHRHLRDRSRLMQMDLPRFVFSAKQTGLYAPHRSQLSYTSASAGP
jgi:hypothetical protein